MTRTFAPILLLIIAVGLFFSYTRPAYDVLQAFQQQEEKLDEAIKDTNKLLEKHDTLITKYGSIPQQDRMRLGKILPNELDVVRLILDVDSLALKNNITIKAFDVPQMDTPTRTNTAQQRSRAGVTPQEDSPIGSAVVTIDCEGEYEDLKSMLFEIERSLSLMDVVRLDVVVSDLSKPGTTEGIKYKIGLQSYWLK